MSEFDDMNLPADFDDLSKHAPLLEKLRGKGDGFVVPGGYFEEMNSVVGFRLSVGQLDGFSVPENYFEELAERIISVVNLQSSVGQSDGFTVPEGYFENLIAEIESLAYLRNTTDNRQPATDNPGQPNTGFTVPENYFTELDETLNTRLALDNLKQDEGFTVPEGYFEKLTGKVMAQASLDAMSAGSDADVPEGYFDTLAGRIAARITAEEGGAQEETQERSRIIVFAEVIRRYARPVALAASAALLIGVSTWFLNREDKIEPGLADKNNAPKTQPVQPVIPQTVDTAVVQPRQPVVQPDILVQTDTMKVKRKQPKNVAPLNLQQEQVVQVEKQDVMESYDMLDENTVADYIVMANPEMGDAQDEEFLTPAMNQYILDNNLPLDILLEGTGTDLNELP